LYKKGSRSWEISGYINIRKGVGHDRIKVLNLVVFELNIMFKITCKIYFNSSDKYFKSYQNRLQGVN
jgi:hypothetical protein